jgi:hypothetical protein
MCSGLYIQQALDKCTRGSLFCKWGFLFFVAASLPCTRARACVQTPPAATGFQESQLPGRPCQFRTPVPAGAFQAALSVFARGGAKGETEALQSALAMVTRRWRGAVVFRAPARLRAGTGQ